MYISQGSMHGRSFYCEKKASPDLANLRSANMKKKMSKNIGQFFVFSCTLFATHYVTLEYIRAWFI